MPRYAKTASKDVKRALERRKAGTLKNGKSGKSVKKQKAGYRELSEARSKGKKVPKKRSG